MDLRNDERVLFHGHPSWGSMLGLYVRGFLAAVGLGALVGVVSGLAHGHAQGLPITVTVLAIAAITAASAAARRAAVTYTITDRRLTIERGLLSRETDETRIERVQNVSCRQSLLERVVGVGTVDFDTAGGAGYDFAFRGVAGPREIARTVDGALHRLQRPDPYAVDLPDPYSLR